MPKAEDSTLQVAIVGTDVVTLLICPYYLLSSYGITFDDVRAQRASWMMVANIASFSAILLRQFTALMRFEPRAKAVCDHLSALTTTPIRRCQKTLD